METYKGMDGFKTGYINAAGFNLVASAYRDGRRLIGVVFGGRSSKTRNAHMQEIMDAGFKKARRVRFAHYMDPPKPTSKPSLNGQPVEIAALNKAAQHAVSPNYAALNQKIENGNFDEMIGQGDIDHSMSKRIQTGLIAVGMHKGDYKVKPNPVQSQAATDLNTILARQTSPEKNNSLKQNSWSIQIGAYASHEMSERALQSAKKILPDQFDHVRSLILPLRTSQGVAYRARLTGLNEEQSQKACTYFKDCMAVMPLFDHIATNE